MGTDKSRALHVSSKKWKKTHLYGVMKELHFCAFRKQQQRLSAQLWPLREWSLWACGLELRFRLPPPMTIRSDRQQAFWGVPAGPSKPILGKIGKPVGCVDERASLSQRTELTGVSSHPFLSDEASYQDTGLCTWSLITLSWTPAKSPQMAFLDPVSPLVYGDAFTGLYGAKWVLLNEWFSVNFPNVGCYC